MSVIKLKKDNFSEIVTDNETVLIDFYADWCGPCRMIAPMIEEIAEEREDILVGKINVDDAPRIAEQFGVMSIPTLIVLRDGKEAARMVGLRPKADILKALD